jgi:hypothetical protein
MAKATAKTTVTVEAIVLELSVKEAEVLSDVCLHIGGAGSSSRRGLTAAIYQALRSAGIKYDAQRLADIRPSSIWFNDSKETK